MVRRRKGGVLEEGKVVDSEIHSIEVPEDLDEDESPSSSEDEIEDDPVVKTYDLFVSNQLKDHVYLLQYPLRLPTDQYAEESAPFEARIKPNEGTLELDVPIFSGNSNVLRQQKFAGSQTESKGKAETKVIDRQRLSGKSHPNQANYFVATVRGDQVHLTPIKATLQLRPNFHYYDTAFGVDKKKKGQTEQSSIKQPRAQQMRSSDEPRDSRTAGVQQPVLYEEFIPLQWIDTNRAETMSIMDQLLSPDTSTEYVSSVSSTEFFSQLFFKDDPEDIKAAKRES